jgi:ABC-type antimicrobial peptide transport system permease subunit
VIASSLSCDKSALLIITLPVVGWSMPPNKFSKVDLPQPDCPIISILGFQFFPKDVFYISRFPSEIHLDDVIMVAIGAFILVVLASIYPAKRAGKLQISKVLNHE